MSFVDYLSEGLRVQQRMLADDGLLSNIQTVADAIVAAMRRGNKVMLAGNGGSAADAQHIAAEFVVRFNLDRSSLPAMALTVDSSIMTAAANDYGYEYLFSRQLQAYGQRGDLFIGITTSGNSRNILHAVEMARELGIVSVGLSGDGGDIHARADHVLAVPASVTSHVQEAHIVIGHYLCLHVERELFAK